MADDINIVISVEDRDVIRARRHQNKLQAAVAQLEKEFRKQNITGSKMRSELNKQASALSRLGGSYKKALSEVNTYASTLSRATDAQVHQAQSMAMAKRGMNKFGMISQQVGYQVGDFFVQVQSGTSALVAFGQQGTQLAGLIPGIGGAIIGIGLAIGTMVLRTRQQMKEAEEGIMSFGKAIKGLETMVQDLGKEIRLLRSGFMTEEELSIFLELNEAIKKVEKQKKKIAAGIKGTVVDSIFGKDLSGKANAAVATLLLLEKNVDKLKARLREISAKRAEKSELEEQKELLSRPDASIILALEKRKKLFEDAYKKISDAKKKNELILSKESERLAKVAFERAMAFSEAYDNALYGEQRARRLQLIKEAKEAEIAENERLAKVQFDRAMAFSQAYDNALYGKDRARRLQLIKEAKEAEIKENERLAKVQFERAMSFQQAYSTMLFNAKKKQAAKEKSILIGKYSDAYSGRDLADASFAEGSEEIRLAQEKIKLLEIENKYGKKSKELYNAITQSQLDALIYSQKENDLSETTNKELQKQLVAYRELLLLSKEQDKLNQKREAFEATVSGYLESGFMSMIDGTKSVTDAFRSMARDVIKELYRILVVQQIVNQAKTAIQSLSGFAFPSASSGLPNYSPPTVSANGNAFNNGKIIPYANGGVVSSPTMFPMSGGKTGLMGEAGPEAILPLKRGPNGKLGVESSGGSVVVNQTINVSTGVAQTVRNEIKTLMPQIAEGAKSAVLDAKRRGGSFGSAFA